MARVTIRKLDDDVKRRLRIQAAKNGRSMEAEARAILTAAMSRQSRKELPERGLGTLIHELFKPLGGVELEIPPREPPRPLPTFD